MIYKKAYALSDIQLKRYDKLDAEYMQMHTDPDNCIPKFIMPVRGTFNPVWEEMLSDKEVMLKYHLEKHIPHIEVGDDCVLYARVDFGTCVVANAFGCDVFYPVNNLPCAKDHVVKTREQIYSLKTPDIDCAPYKKVKEWTEFFVENLPDGYHMMMADIQGPFNNAHLVRGTDIFYDMYDDIEAFDKLMEVVTDATIEYAKAQRQWADMKDGWQYDWSALWKGNARISNCSLHMIGRDLYIDHVMKHDIKLIEKMNGARMHYCGTAKNVIEEMAKIPHITGIDYDSLLHDIEETMDNVPKDLTLLQSLSLSSDTAKKILSSKTWPFKKRNVIFSLRGPMTIEEGKELYRRFRKVAEN